MPAQESPTPLRVAIIGGGMIGMALAVPLARAQENGASIDVHVYEAASAFTEIGAGIGIGPSGQRVLARLGMAQTLDKQAGDGNPDKMFDIRRSDPGLSMKESFVAAMTGKNTGLGIMHRADFLNALVSLFPTGQVTFSKRLDHYIDRPGEPIRLKFTDGTIAEADVLIGCDGIKSATRRCMFADDPASDAPESEATRAKYSGWTTYRALVPPEALSEVAGELKTEPNLWIGKDCHLGTMPIRQGKLLVLVGSVRDPSGARAVGKTGPWSDKVHPSVMQEDFKAFNEKCQAVIQAVPELISWGIFDLPELPRYNSGRVAIAGDAAHASTPFLASGGGSGIEDILILHAVLTHPAVLANPAKNIPAALAAYSHVRQPRATKIQRTSTQTGMLYDYCLPGVMDDYKKIATEMEEGKGLRWIWEWDEEQAIQEALHYLNAELAK